MASALTGSLKPVACCLYYKRTPFRLCLLVDLSFTMKGYSRFRSIRENGADLN